MNVIHAAYRPVQMACRAWTPSEDRAAAQARVIVRELFDAGLLVADGFELHNGLVVRREPK
jgi:hypothetical protein